ncbi:MAG: copper chaperone PCu(A)C [Novosphingobium sp.]|nr:copper chaperone PCu(A)C [Novosphingobium sp.]
MRPTLALLCTALALAGCHRGSAEKPAVPGARPEVSVSDARLVLPTVPGHPGAAYFTLANTGTAPATLTGVTIDGVERGEMHQSSGATMAAITSVEVKPGGQVAFAPGGRHVMAFNLAPTLKPGTITAMTLSFASGKTIKAPLRVEKLGGGEADAMSGMAGMGKP